MGTKLIVSRDNPAFKRLLRLAHSSRERRESGLSLLDGVHLLQAYAENYGAPRDVVITQSMLADPEVAEVLAGWSSVRTTVLADGLFRELSSVATPTGVIAVVETPASNASVPHTGACLALEGIQDPGNLGSILRSAAAAGMKHVLISSGSVHAWSPRVLRAGMGAHFKLHIHENVDLPATLAAYRGRALATTGAASASIYAVDLTGDVMLLFGSEGAGLSKEVVDVSHAAMAIPMPGGTESLNVAAAAAIVLFERLRQSGAAEVQ